MTKETKNLSLIDFKATDEGGNGGFTAIATTFGELDSVGDIILAGAYKRTIPQFLRKGFIARNHSWSSAIGMPISAKENDEGLIVGARYHSTDEAKAARLVTNERTEQGLEIAVSIGYELSAPPIYVYPKDYSSELPKYVRPDLLESAMQMAPRFAKVRVLPEIHLYEISLVQVGALESALVLSAKSADPTDKAASMPDVKGMFEEELANRTNNLYVFGSVLWDVIYRLQELAAGMVGTGLTFDLPAMLDEALSEYVERVRAYVLADIATYGDGSMDFTSAETAAAVKRALADGTTFAAHLEAVVDAATSVVERAQKRAQTRREEKEGRTISAATREKIRAIYDRIVEIMPTLEVLMAEPDDKEEGKATLSTEDIRRMVVQSLVRDARYRQEEYVHGY